MLIQGVQPTVGTDALREVVLTINTQMAALTTLNIQTGAGGGPATVAGDATIELPVTGAEFAAAGIIVVLKNGQSLIRGPSVASGEARWISMTELAFDKKLKPGDDVRVISPLPPP